MQPRGEIKVNPEDYFTYQQAAAELDRSVESIQKAVSAGILHPVRFPPSNTRYLPREEVQRLKDKPHSMAIAEAYRQLNEAREEIAEVRIRMQEKPAVPT